MVGTGASVGATAALGRAVLRRGCWLRPLSAFWVDLASFDLLAIFSLHPSFPELGCCLFYQRSWRIPPKISMWAIKGMDQDAVIYYTFVTCA
ncbi:MAG TPA: hypothetical protein VN428_14580, partial [Bryobacteraceae bacterium]|nr:hypothetical protein [Bryobacteraceae bacterium]